MDCKGNDEKCYSRARHEAIAPIWNITLKTSLRLILDGLGARSPARGRYIRRNLPRSSRHHRARTVARLRNLPRLSREALAARARPARTCWRRLCPSTSSMDTGTYSAAGSLDVRLAGAAVAESCDTVAPRGLLLTIRLGSPPWSPLVVARWSRWFET